ncbi:MAG: hypothetical protein LBQ74_13975 [Prevotella sp.]|jgi:hypothetical protein|nr:hypothetical protein [Prevotella sp.]
MKGICFIPPLYDATVEERKRQTRRIMVPQPDTIRNIAQYLFDKKPEGIFTKQYETVAPVYSFPVANHKIINPKYNVGDILYLKEPYKITHSHNDWYVDYKFAGEKMELPFSWGHKGLEKLCIQQEKSKSGWLNKLFMPAWCARRFIKIIGVRAERLQDITEGDCFREGIEDCDYGGMQCVVYGLREGLFFDELEATPIKAYAALIDRINGKGTWDSNPYVWVYDYELTEKPE